MTDTHNMTTGSLSKKIFIFSLPLILTNLLQVLFNMADVAVVGRFAGSSALGSVGSTSTLSMLFTGVLIGVASGVNVLCARDLGAKNDRSLKETVHSSAIVCLFVGLFLAALGLTLSRAVLDLMGTKDELIDGAVLYFRIYSLGMPALALYNFGTGVLGAAGDTKRTLFYLGAAGAVNILLNRFFVSVCHMSVAGVAIATVISQYLSAFLILRFLFTCGEPYALSLGALRLHPQKTRAVLALGIPAGFQNAIFAIANSFIQAGVNTFDAVVVEGNSAASNADGLVYDVMNAFYVACSSFMGQNYGAGKRDRVIKSYLISLAYSFLAGAVLGVSLVLLGGSFLSLFTTDAAVVAAGMQRLKIMGFSYAVSAFMDCTIAASRGLGKSLVPTVMVIMGSCVFRVTWIYTVFAHFGTIPSLYLLYVFSWSLTAIAEIIYFVYCYKKQMKAL